MLGVFDDVWVAAYTMTAKDFVKSLWDEISVTPELRCIGGIYWVNVWSYVQVLVNVLEKYPLGAGTFRFLGLGCRCCWWISGGGSLCRYLSDWCICGVILLGYHVCLVGLEGCVCCFLVSWLLVFPFDNSIGLYHGILGYWIINSVVNVKGE